MKKIFLFLFFISQLFASNNTVKICNDIGEWAPYFYYERIEDGVKTEKLVGATVDSLDAIFKKIDENYKFELLPWKRCVAYVQRYDKAQKYEMFSEAGVNSWRKEHFLHTKEPVYSRTDVFYYNKEKFPNGMKINSVEDMSKYKICVASGFSFERYIKAGLDPSLVDTSHKSDYFDIIRKISLGRCDILPANLAIIEGGKKIKQFKLPKNVDYIKDNVINNTFYYHYWISKTSPRSEELRNKIDQAIKELKDSGEWEEIYKKYLPLGSGLKR